MEKQNNSSENKSETLNSDTFQDHEAFVINRIKSQETSQTDSSKRIQEEPSPGIQITSDPDEQTTSPYFSRIPVIVALIVVGFILSYCLACWFWPKPSLASMQVSRHFRRPEPGKALDVVEKAPDSIVVGESILPPERPIIPPQEQRTFSKSEEGSVNNQDYQQQMQMQRQMQREQEEAQKQAARTAYLKQVYEAPSTVYSSDNNPSKAQPMPQELDSQNVANSMGPPILKGHLSSLESSTYLPHTRVASISPYEIKAGTVIPAVMISGINSDLPGQLIAQVSSNVFDSATGKYLLIPQGARLVGTYEHNINAGQQRVLIIWNRIIYLDSSSLNLEAMSGQDQSGYAGFRDKVNNHTVSRFGEAIFLSAITAGVQLSQSRTRQGDYSYSPQQVIAGSLGMQLNQMGMTAYQSRVNQAPTLTIRPGYCFNVMVSKDIVFPPCMNQKDCRMRP